jgi:hypothetical protein
VDAVVRGRGRSITQRARRISSKFSIVGKRNKIFKVREKFDHVQILTLIDFQKVEKKTAFPGHFRQSTKQVIMNVPELSAFGLNY